MSEHRATVEWRQQGEFRYETYSRAHMIDFGHGIRVPGNAAAENIPTTVAPAAGVDPEQQFVASLSSCHMLWYLHLCAVNNVIVTGYKDEASGTMTENNDGSGEFTEVLLRPRVTVKEASMMAKANELHHEANKMCFLARSMKFPVKHEPQAIAQ